MVILHFNCLRPVPVESVCLLFRLSELQIFDASSIKFYESPIPLLHQVKTQNYQLYLQWTTCIFTRELLKKSNIIYVKKVTFEGNQLSTY